jgi:hypothetical protein
MTSALVGDDWPASLPRLFTLAERAPGTQWIGDWVGLFAGLDCVDKKHA